jgi:hypothetical protein
MKRAIRGPGANGNADVCIESRLIGHAIRHLRIVFIASAANRRQIIDAAVTSSVPRDRRARVILRLSPLPPRVKLGGVMTGATSTQAAASRFALPALLALAFALYAIPFNFPPNWQTDELALYMREMRGWRNWQYHGLYPPLQVYIIKVLILEPVAFLRAVFDSPPTRTFITRAEQDLLVIHLARPLNAAMATALVAATYDLARRLFGRPSALWAAALVVFTPTFCNLAHFSTVDIPSALWAVLALGAMARAAESARPRWFALAGVYCGASAATKYVGGAVLLALAAVVVHLFRSGASSKPAPFALRVLLLAAVTPVAAAVAFFAFHPYALLDFAEFRLDLKFLAEEQRYFMGGKETIGALSAPVMLYRIHGAAFIGFAVFGAISAWRGGRRFALLLLASAALSQYAVVATTRFMPPRYLLLFTPILAVVAGFGLHRAACFFHGRTRTDTDVCGEGRRFGWAVCLLALLFARPVAATLMVPYLFLRGDPRLRLVREELASTRPPDASLAAWSHEWGHPTLPEDEGHVTLEGEHEWPFGVESHLLARRPIGVLTADSWVERAPPPGFIVVKTIEPARVFGFLPMPPLEELNLRADFWTPDRPYDRWRALGSGVWLRGLLPGSLDLTIESAEPAGGFILPNPDPRLAGHRLAWFIEGEGGFRLAAVSPPAVRGDPVHAPIELPPGESRVSVHLLPDPARRDAAPAAEIESLLGPIDLAARPLDSPTTESLRLIAPTDPVQRDWSAWGRQAPGERFAVRIEGERLVLAPTSSASIERF